MKRLQIMLEDDTYEALGVEAIKGHTSKASLVRRYLRLSLNPLPSLDEDPLSALAGSGDFEPTDVDETVYGR
ncbi:MAG: ribbon-helix-helix domain-containing protein [Solirubrobacteraceae bacterium]